MDGRYFVFVKGQISQPLENLKIGQLYRITFVTAHPPVLGAVLANKEGYVQIGDKRHVLMKCYNMSMNVFTLSLVVIMVMKDCLLYFDIVE
jgi:hypothetical protein